MDETFPLNYPTPFSPKGYLKTDVLSLPYPFPVSPAALLSDGTHNILFKGPSLLNNLFHDEYPSFAVSLTPVSFITWNSGAPSVIGDG